MKNSQVVTNAFNIPHYSYKGSNFCYKTETKTFYSYNKPIARFKRIGFVSVYHKNRIQEISNIIHEDENIKSGTLLQLQNMLMNMYKDFEEGTEIMTVVEVAGLTKQHCHFISGTTSRHVNLILRHLEESHNENKPFYRVICPEIFAGGNVEHQQTD